MTSPRFYLPRISPQEPCALPQEEAHHLRDVLRLKPGERIFLLNGSGEEWEGRVEALGKREVVVRAERLHRKEAPPRVRCELLVPLLKGGRTEFLVEKAVELAITRILPFVSRYTVVRPSERTWVRLSRRAIQALKQSGRLWIPEIEPPGELRELLFRVRAGQRYFAYEKGGCPLNQVFDPLPEDLALASGPEGGFAEEEVELFERHGFIPLDLGPYILRAETAVLFLMSIWRYQTLRG